MQIIIHRGTHQIGGTITEIATKQARIIIDVGAELPSIDTSKNAKSCIDGVTNGKADCDGVFITHYHGDHIGLFDAVLPDVPIYMGEVAKQIYAVLQRTLKKKFKIGNPKRVDEFNTFQMGKPIVIKDITITPLCVDHSAFDAYMFLIESAGKRVLHTGDFRMHGAKGSTMYNVFEKYAQNIDVLIIEGTMLSRQGEKQMTEYELGQKARQIIKDNKNVFILASSTNIDRIAEFYSATIVNRKPFVICEQELQGEILKIVTDNSRSSLYNFNKKKICIYNSYNKKLFDYMNDCGFCFLGRTNYITKKALEMFPNNILIYSMWQGYLNKNHAAYDNHKGNFIDNAIASGSKIEYLHTSGHASVEQIEQVCKITSAKVIVPIHSESPETFNDLTITGKVKVLQDGEKIIV